MPLQGNDQRALTELYRLLWSIEKQGFSEQDLQLLKKKYLANNKKQITRSNYNNSKKVAALLVRASSENIKAIDRRFKNKLRAELITKVTKEELNNHFKKILSIKDRVIVFANKSGNKTTKQTSIESINEARYRTFKISTSSKAHKDLSINKLEPKKIISQSFNEKTKSYNYFLENGIKVVFKETKYSKNKVFLRATSTGGSSLYDVKDINNIKHFESFISKSGVAGISSDDLKEILFNKNINVKFKIGRVNEKIHARADITDVEAMFQLLYLRITQPYINNSVAIKEKKRLQRIVKQSNFNPIVRFNNEVNLHLQKNNLRYFTDTKESINKLDKNRMIEIFKERFGDLNNFTFFIVGEIDKDKLEYLITKYLGNLPINDRKEKVIDRRFNFVKGKQRFIRYYYNENISRVGLLYKSNTSYSVKNKVTLNILKNITDIRLRKKIREEKSGSYHVKINAYLSKVIHNDSTVYISFSSDPKRIKSLIQDTYSVIEQLKNGIITDTELNTAKKILITQLKREMYNNKFWLSVMEEADRSNIPLEHVFDLPKLIEETTIENIHIMAKNMFSENVLQQELHPKEK